MALYPRLTRCLAYLGLISTDGDIRVIGGGMASEMGKKDGAGVGAVSILGAIGPI